MKKCVFFDRDGIVNKHPGPGYVERWEDFVLLPEFAAVLRTVLGLGYEAVVVTNQRGIAKGVVPMKEVERMHSNLRALLEKEHNLKLLDILYCPHHEGECNCRKPKPGMLLEAAKRHGLDLKASWMIGDDERDVEAGRRAGCRTVLVGPLDIKTLADVHVSSMVELQSRIANVLSLS